MRNRIVAIMSLAWVPLCLWTAGPCAGQTTGPEIFFIYPAGGQLGKTIEATVAGQQLKGAKTVYVSGKGVAARMVPEAKPDPNAKPKPGSPPPRPWINTNGRPTETVRIAIAIAPDAELGEHDLRLVTPTGVTSRVRFIVDQVAETVALERNSEKAEAVPVPSLPAIINGQIYTATTIQGGPDRQGGTDLGLRVSGPVLTAL
jgi:hypothetical protein